MTVMENTKGDICNRVPDIESFLKCATSKQHYPVATTHILLPHQLERYPKYGVSSFSYPNTTLQYTTGENPAGLLQELQNVAFLCTTITAG